jgi:D-aspartate ligase
MMERLIVTGTRAGARRIRSPQSTACVLGDLDLVAPLALAGIGVSLVAPPGDPARYTRRAVFVGWADPSAEPEPLLALLLDHARRQPARPVLFYESDAFTLFVGRHRKALAQEYHVLIAEQGLLEDLLDKLRFRDLAARLGLPVPASGLLAPDARHVPELAFPLLVKPSGRDADWTRMEPAGKAMRVNTAAELAALRSRLAAYGRTVLLQQLIDGPESRIESYHCYIDEHGELAAEFTGRKIRTRPVEFGRTTALTITDAADVAELGREIVRRLELRGVAKLDFKRDADGRLWLLEVNPRYTLWLHAGARAGVNIPATVWADLTGQPRPPAGPVRYGVSWFSSWDLQAARQWGVPMGEWTRWAVRCKARSMMAFSDPLPLLRLALVRARRVLRRG